MGGKKDFFSKGGGGEEVKSGEYSTWLSKPQKTVVKYVKKNSVKEIGKLPSVNDLQTVDTTSVKTSASLGNVP